MAQNFLLFLIIMAFWLNTKGGFFVKRCAGILLPISSLPSQYGIGSFDKSAYQFVDFLQKCGQSLWQILPLGPTGFGDSPYQSFSTFAGNPYFISLDDLISENLLTRNDCENADFGTNVRFVDYERLYKNRIVLLEKAYKNSSIENDFQYKIFCNENIWLEDYALFMAIKDEFSGKALSQWDDDIRRRKSSEIVKYREKLCEKINFYKFLQFVFFKQWKRLKSYANARGIKIIGDIPIYVAADSADVWADPQLFYLDSNNILKAVAGCPPDGFSAKGQLWGNPLYDWKYHRKTQYSWWISRLKHCFEMYDVVRIDHFRGFDEYYSIPFGSSDAKEGHWEKGPGSELFCAVKNALGERQIIAEDLGFVTDSVKKLVRECKFANMKVLQFAFDSRDTGNSEDYLPHNYNKNCVVYTGTHDNQTIVSWYKTICESERKNAREYMCDEYTPDDEIYKSFISLVMQSVADVCVIPMQDWLGLDDKARMNTPATIGNNWKWRMTHEEMNDHLAERICRITKIYNR